MLLRSAPLETRFATRHEVSLRAGSSPPRPLVHVQGPERGRGRQREAAPAATFRSASRRAARTRVGPAPPERWPPGYPDHAQRREGGPRVAASSGRERRSRAGSPIAHRPGRRRRRPPWCRSVPISLSSRRPESQPEALARRILIRARARRRDRPDVRACGRRPRARELPEQFGDRRLAVLAQQSRRAHTCQHLRHRTRRPAQRSSDLSHRSRLLWT